ncbi:unnamed protein product [Caenorhabditis angaria]|uniref:Uncharacterized protein n=1 Tax=Caenorhabditis angaria TaxID=860376 RepID=A0A9P1N889_9PELO|nr:unnamed protein product [Caenorhabditis angaria]
MNCTRFMLRNEYFVNMYANPRSSLLVSSIFIFILLSLVSFHCLLFNLHLRVRQKLHPFFAIIFGIVIIMHVLYTFGELVSHCIFLIFPNNSAMFYSMVLTRLSYSAISPLCFGCVFERLFATILVAKYESYRNWFLFLVIIIPPIAIFIYFDFIHHDTAYELSAVSLITVLACIVLYFFNRKMTENCENLDFVATISVSEKYQILENMVVVRKGLLPILILGLLINLSDFVAYRITEKMIDGKSDCQQHKVYIPYIIFNGLSVFLEYCVPLSIILEWKHYRSNLSPCCRRFFGATGKVAAITETNVQIRNALGKVISKHPTTSEYFDNLNMQWG